MMNNYQVPEYFSPEQQEAILIDKTNVLVSAAAGCGKTTLLVERVLRKIIRDEVPLNKLIVVTFTEAAASELKERIESELNKVLKKNNDNEFIKEQLTKLNDAYIMTFHALCLRLLKENQASFNYQDKLQPSSELVLNNIKRQAFEQLNNDCFNEEEYQSLNERFSNVVSNEYFHSVLEHTRKLVLSNASFDELKKYHQKQNHSGDLFKHGNFGKEFNDYLIYNLNQCIELLNICLSDDNNEEKLNNNIKDNIEKIKLIINLIKTQQYGNLKEEINNFKILSKPGENKTYPYKKIPSIKIYHGEIKTIINDKIKYFFIDEASIANILENNDQNALTLLKYTQIYENNLKDIKKQTGLIEFDDFEQDILDLLYDGNNFSETSLKLKEHFNEILVDEYQDTNLVQERIVFALANGSNTFMVGDLKQSIYRFRKATPKLFVDKYESYKNSDEGVAIDLSGNYRSKNEVLETTNYIFKNIFSKQIGGIDYDEINQLKFKNEKLNEKYPDSYPTKFFFNVIDDVSEMNDEEKDKLKLTIKKDQLYQNSANAIVSEIKKLYSKDVKYKDICILVSKRNRSEHLIELLEIAQIPYMFHTNSGFFQTYEINDLTNLIKTLINPNDDIALLGSLHSFFFNLDEDDLLTISLLDGYSYYQKLKNSDYHEVIELLDKLIKYAKKHHPFDLINYIYQESNYFSYLVNFKNYEQAMINITNFKNLINDNYDFYNSLEHLIEDIESGLNKSFDSTTPAILSQKDDVINIMSIHQSKGLEFNYVFLFDDSDVKKRESNMIGIDYYKNQLILPYFDSNLKIKADNPLKKLKVFLEEKEVISESLRVLYVALTRAKIQLYLFTNIKQSFLNKNLLSLQNSSQDFLLKENLILNQKGLMDYVLLALLRHRDSLLLRTGYNIAVDDEVYNYNNKLVDFYKYEEIKIKPDNYYQKRMDDFKVVAPKKITQAIIENITPSKHFVSSLDFDQISSFDTYKQGSNVHLVLELIDFKNPNNIEKIFDKYEISKDNREGINAFLNSDFFKTKVILNNYFKEYAFNYLENNKLINGIIDLYIESDENIYIIDYKSDKLSINELKEYYTSQLQVYYDVISNINEKKIECYIYSLYHKEFIKLI